MTKIQKFVAIVKEMDKDKKNKFDFSAVINFSDAHKADETVIVNDILQKHCLNNGLLFNNNNNNLITIFRLDR